MKAVERTAIGGEEASGGSLFGKGGWRAAGEGNGLEEVEEGGGKNGVERAVRTVEGLWVGEEDSKRGWEEG